MFSSESAGGVGESVTSPLMTIGMSAEAKGLWSRPVEREWLPREIPLEYGQLATLISREMEYKLSWAGSSKPRCDKGANSEIAAGIGFADEVFDRFTAEIIQRDVQANFDSLDTTEPGQPIG